MATPKATSSDSLLLRYLPSSVEPYAELSRYHFPSGSLYLYFPCLFGSLFAAISTSSDTGPTPWQLLKTNGIFLVGSIMVHGAGCTWNDLIDVDLDRKVARTRMRPIARGSVSPKSALIWLGIQILVGILIVLITLPRACLYYAMPSMALTAIYPFSKRFTYYPQVILGCVFGWGLVMSFPALEIEPSTPAVIGAGCLYGAVITWMVLFDTIYAAQDIKDDLKEGMKSTAVLHASSLKGFISILACAQVIFLSLSGMAVELGQGYWIFGCGGTLACLIVIISKVDLQKGESCIYWFNNGCFLTGGAMAAGFMAHWIIH